MKIEEIIYQTLSGSADLVEIFGENIYPLSGKMNQVPVLLYQIYQYDEESTKTSASLKDAYLLKLHVFSEDYKEVIDTGDILKDLLDFKELTDLEDNVLVDLVRFSKYSDEYENGAELFNRTYEFELQVYN